MCCATYRQQHVASVYWIYLVLVLHVDYTIRVRDCTYNCWTTPRWVAARVSSVESTDASGDNDATRDALGDLGRALCQEPDVVDLHRVLLNPPRAVTRVRDMFPLPFIACHVCTA